MADYSHAAAYVAAHGTEVDAARLAHLLGDPVAAALVPAAVAQLAAQRGPQGGYAAPWSADAESVDATCTRLDQLRDLGPSAAALSDHALTFLAGRQRADGSILEEDLTGRLAPEWADPASARSVLYLTAHAGYWLATSPVHDHSAALAADHLARRLAEIRSPDSYIPTVWLSASLLATTRRVADVEDLERGLAAVVEDLGADSLAWLANTLPHSEVANAARFRLRWRQEPDGRWASEQGPDNDTAVTVAAVRALLVGDRMDDATPV